MSVPSLLADLVDTQPLHRCTAPRRDGTGPCNRPIWDGESIARGDIGPDCWERLHPAAPATRRRPRASTQPVRRVPVTEPGPDQLDLLDAGDELGQVCP